jgi:hypothetical protein
MWICKGNHSQWDCWNFADRDSCVQCRLAKGKGAESGGTLRGGHAIAHNGAVGAGCCLAAAAKVAPAKPPASARARAGGGAKATAGGQTLTLPLPTHF